MERATRYDAYELPVVDILYDQEFNCRRPFSLESVDNLANNIAQNGLEIALIVQPIEDTKILCKEAWRLLAGHRRFVAVTKRLGWEKVPCVIRRGLTQEQAELLNLTENLERNDLNPLEEALALAKLFPDEVSPVRIGRAIKRSAEWVMLRLQLLRMPDQVQQMVVSGRLSLSDLSVLDKIGERGKQLAAAEKIASSKMKKGLKARTIDIDRVAGTNLAKTTARVRTRAEVTREVRRMLERGITGLAPRFGAWFAGHITDDDWEKDLQEEFSRMREEFSERKS